MNDKFSPDTPKETAFLLDNFIEFARVFKDDNKKGPLNHMTSETELEQSVNVEQIESQSEFGYVPKLFTGVEAKIDSLEVMLTDPESHYGLAGKTSKDSAKAREICEDLI